MPIKGSREAGKKGGRGASEGLFSKMGAPRPSHKFVGRGPFQGLLRSSLCAFGPKGAVKAETRASDGGRLTRGCPLLPPAPSNMLDE